MDTPKATELAEELELEDHPDPHPATPWAPKDISRSGEVTELRFFQDGHSISCDITVHTIQGDVVVRVTSQTELDGIEVGTRVDVILRTRTP